MPQTRLQSAHVQISGVESCYHTLEKCPIMDSTVADRLTEGNRIITVTSNNTKFIWEHNGDVIRHDEDGTITTWWAVPTMNAAINRNPHEGMYYRFYPNGSIGMRVNEGAFYWGPLVSGEPVIGESIVSVCDCYDCYYDHESICSRHYYGSDCYCYDRGD
jgi:hypothetical protein